MNNNNEDIVKKLRDSLPPQIDYAELVDSPVPSSYGQCFVWDDPIPYMIEEAADLIDSLRTQLSESQRRERAAVEDIPHMCEFCNRIRCDDCNRSRENDPYTATKDYWQWRGPQADGKGEAE